MTTTTFNPNTRPDAVNGYYDPAYVPAGYVPAGWTAPTTTEHRPMSQNHPNQHPAMNPTMDRATNPAEPRLDQMRYWVGAGITAVIAALVSLVALVIAQGIVHVPVAFGSGPTLTPVHTAVYGLCAAGVALLAAALYDAMLQVAPRPLTYYSWLAAIVTVLATLLPFTSTAGLHAQIALAATNFAVGVIVTLLVPIAASNARRPTSQR